MLDHIKEYAISIHTEANRRDWGKSITLKTIPLSDEAYSYREKFLVFNPGASIILEKHTGYDEVWMADRAFEYILEVDGSLRKLLAEKHERIVVSRGMKHKIINPNQEELCIFEIQMGHIRLDDKEQFAEDDIYD